MTFIDATFGASYDGAVLGTVLYGVTCCQVVRYYATYKEDTRSLKFFVAFIWLMDTFNQILIVHFLWYYLIILRSRPFPLSAAMTANWSVIGQVIPTEITAGLVESFFILRGWRLSGKRKWVLILFTPISISFIFSIGYLIKSFLLPSFADSSRYPWLLAMIGGPRTVTDVSIAAAMFWILVKRRSRNEFKFTRKSDTVIKILVRYTVTTGVLTSVLTFIDLIMFLNMPDNMIYIGIYFVHGKIYTNSMLAALNSREILRRVANEEIDLSSVPRTDRSGPTAATNPIAREIQ